jgi:hypothetical protein
MKNNGLPTFPCFNKFLPSTMSDAERERVFRRLMASMPIASNSNNDVVVSTATSTIDALAFDYPQLTQSGVDALCTHWTSATTTFAQRQRELPLSPQLLERIDSAANGACNVDKLRALLLIRAIRPLLAMPRDEASRHIASFHVVMPTTTTIESAVVEDAAIVELVAAEQDDDNYVFEDYDDDSNHDDDDDDDVGSMIVASPAVVVDDALLWNDRLIAFSQHLTYDRIASAWSDENVCAALFDALSALVAQADDNAALDALLPRLCFIVRDHCLQNHTGDEMTRLLQLLLDAPHRKPVAERCAHLAIAVMTSMTSIHDVGVARYALERLSFLAARAAVPGVHVTQLTALARIVVHGVALDDRIGAAVLPSRFVHSYLRFFLDNSLDKSATTHLTLRGAWPRADADDLEGEALLLVSAHVPKVLDFLLAVPDFAARVASAEFAALHNAWFGAWLVLRAWQAKRSNNSNSVDSLVKQLESSVLTPLSVTSPLEAARVFEWQAALKRIAQEQSQTSIVYWSDAAARHAARLQPQIGARLAALDDERERGTVLRLQRAVKAMARDGAQKKD